MKLSIIIVNYNVRHFLEQALLSVRKATAELEAEVWVVDNNSQDDSVEMVRSMFPEVNLIANKDNPGFSRANNQAIRQCAGKYILLLNPDTVVAEDTFQKCCHFMEDHPEAGALGVKMIDGAGNFLPESKRGFPAPWVAFCKTFGFSRIFPRSKLFNHYHLGYLEENQNHEIEVLAGAFMFMRRSALDKVGLLDEDFFMYGEDIDLSYRIIQGGYKNYYLADTQIMHYKGESTKKGSLNYVKVFYRAMIIFAKKHFKGRQASWFVGTLQLAIYFRAFLTVVSNFLKKAWFPVIDATLIATGLIWVKHLWALNYYGNAAYYTDSFYFFNLPLYTMGWIGSVFFTGGYDQPYRIGRVVRGVVLGTILIAAVYGFLPLELRPSRAIILFGAIWAAFILSAWRSLTHFFTYGTLPADSDPDRKMAIVGNSLEAHRVLDLLNKARVERNYMGVIGVGDPLKEPMYLGDEKDLIKWVSVYELEELIFCAKDLSNKKIMDHLVGLGNRITYKIVPPGSDSIIGSSSKNTSGEVYLAETRFAINEPTPRRNKRVLDFVAALLFWIGFPLFFILSRNKKFFFSNITQVLIGRKSMVGYTPISQKVREIPALKPGVLHPAITFKEYTFTEETLDRMNYFYAKDYKVWKDLHILLAAFRYV